MTVIGTNTAAMRAGNASASANLALSTAMERLSTGKRINSAKDDAAGLAIASTMTASIRGMSQAIRNANDGLSMAQTAEGALGEVSNMLQRIRELAVQSASGTYSGTDRANLQSEVAALTSQIKTTLTGTKFNGVTLFDTANTGTGDNSTGSLTGTAGYGTKLTIQTGSNSGDTVDLVVGNTANNTQLTTSVAGTLGTALTGSPAGAAMSIPLRLTIVPKRLDACRPNRASTRPGTGARVRGCR